MRSLRLSLFLLTVCLTTAPLWAQESGYTVEDMLAYFDYDSTQPLNATQNWTESTFFHDVYAVTFESVHGETVTGNLVIPKPLWAGPGPYRTILYIHGYGMDSSIDGFLSDVIYIMEILLGEPYCIFAIDAQYAGLREVPGRDIFSLNFLEDRSALATTVIDNRRAIDFLMQNPDVQHDEINVLGISMGSIIAAMLISVDQRMDAASLIVGGGDWTELISNSDLPPAGPMREAMNYHFEVIPRYFDMVDPINLIANASPQVALQMHNGTNDTTVPTGQLLYDAAGEPKQIYWYNASHYTIVLYTYDILSRTVDWFEQY